MLISSLSLVASPGDMGDLYLAHWLPLTRALWVRQNNETD